MESSNKVDRKTRRNIIATCALIITKIVAVLLVLLIALFASLYVYGHLTNPHVTVLEATDSPDAQWIALVENEEYDSIFTNPYYRVVLRPKSGWFKPLRERKVFESDQQFTQAPPTTEWQDSQTLFISTNSPIKGITRQLNDCAEIRIIYK